MRSAGLKTRPALINTSTEANKKTTMRVMLVTDVPNALEAFKAVAQGTNGTAHEVVALAAPQDTLADMARDAAPDVIVVHVSKPDEYPFTELQTLTEAQPMPVMFLADDERPEIMTQASRAGVCSYLPVETGLKAFPSLAEWTRAQFLTMRELKTRLREKEEKLADRITIERAKGIVMTLKGLSRDQKARHETLATHARRGRTDHRH